MGLEERRLTTVGGTGLLDKNSPNLRKNAGLNSHTYRGDSDAVGPSLRARAIPPANGPLADPGATAMCRCFQPSRFMNGEISMAQSPQAAQFVAPNRYQLSGDGISIGYAPDWALVTQHGLGYFSYQERIGR